MTMPSIGALKIKIFADGADIAGMHEMAADQSTDQGIHHQPDADAQGRRRATTRPSRTRSSRPSRIARSRSRCSPTISPRWSSRRARSRPGARTSTSRSRSPTPRATSPAPLIERLSRAGVKLNVTAVMTLEQVERIAERLDATTPAIVSVFAGRIADTGRDPDAASWRRRSRSCKAEPQGRAACGRARASCSTFSRPTQIGCHIITATNDILKKLSLVGKDLDEYSLRDRRDVLQGRQSRRLHASPPPSRRRQAHDPDAHVLKLRTCSSPAAPAMSAACWCRSCSTRATRSRSTTSCTSAHDFCRRTAPTCG